MAKLILLSILILFLHSVSGQTSRNVKGSGYVLTQQRETDYFHSIIVSRNISVAIVQGELQPLTVEADNNLFPYIKTVVRNGILKIYISDSINITKYADLNVLISMPTLRSLTAYQHSQIDGSPQIWKIPSIQIKASENSQIKLHLETENIEVDGRTSAIIELKGKTQNLKTTLKTSASLKAKDLETIRAEVALATAAKAEIKVASQLSYELAGNVRLTLYGTPAITKSQLTSGSKLIWKK